VEQIERAIRLQPDVPDYPLSLGWAHLANARIGVNENVLESREEARKAFEAALRLLPNEFTYWQALADYHRLTPGARKPAALVSPRPREDNSADGDRSDAALAPEALAAGEGAAGETEGRGSSVGAAALDAPTGDGTESPATPEATPDASVAPASPPAAAPEIPHAIQIYRRLSAARPRDAGLHFILYGQYLKDGNEDEALEELQAAWQVDPSNALYPYLLASHYFEREAQGPAEGEGLPDVDWQGYALDAVQRAGNAPSFVPSPYRPAYPPLLAPALGRALGDTLTPETLSLYDRLSALAQRLNTAGSGWVDGGYPDAAEQIFYDALVLGDRMVNSAMGARDQYLLHLPELSAGLRIQEGALGQLRALYHRYALADRLPWLQQKQLELDSVRQILSRATDTP
jgi:tetratricopeptide (TPR) repeat protein